MIPVHGVQNKSVLVLGMGCSGVASAKALLAGGAKVFCWDDDEAGRLAAEENGFLCKDPIRDSLEGLELIITSPGIPHLYPRPHVVLAEAMRSHFGKGRR